LDDGPGGGAVINGSYFSPQGTPATPVVSEGVLLGPRDYAATHGALVASDGIARLHDFAGETWAGAFEGADDALVSYPLLLATDGTRRVAADPHWLANRSFVGEDAAGRIILGTTTDAFFSLDRFAAFLRQAPLDLTMALNLDGGPVACQGIALKDYRRDFCGRWELAGRDGQRKLLVWGIGARRAAMAIVVAVLRR
jgi:phosphodiester glycosidase